MKAKSWIILGVIGIVIGIIMPFIVSAIVMNAINSGESIMSISQSPVYVLVLPAIGSLFFWGGIVSTAFGLVKYYKEKD
jgi:hypothetical protein